MSDNRILAISLVGFPVLCSLALLPVGFIAHHWEPAVGGGIASVLLSGLALVGAWLARDDEEQP